MALRAHNNPALQEVAAALEKLAAEADAQVNQLEDLERRLASLEDKIVAILRAAQTDEDLYAIRASLDSELSPYRGKMTAEQLSMLRDAILTRRCWSIARSHA